MEKIKSICLMRELVKALSDFEGRLADQHGVSLNEAMMLCCIGKETRTASEISELTGLIASHTSKVIRSIEEKGYIQRSLGETDKRQMHFNLTLEGFNKLESIKEKEIEVPTFLLPCLKKD